MGIFLCQKFRQNFWASFHTSTIRIWKGDGRTFYMLSREFLQIMLEQGELEGHKFASSRTWPFESHSSTYRSSTLRSEHDPLNLTLQHTEALLFDQNMNLWIQFFNVWELCSSIRTWPLNPHPSLPQFSKFRLKSWTVACLLCTSLDWACSPFKIASFDPKGKGSLLVLLQLHHCLYMLA